MGECKVAKNEAKRLVGLMDNETAREVLSKIAAKYPKVLIECDGDVFDEEWGITE